METPTSSTVELWAGVECTVNRVGERYFDQLERSGHDWRVDDLDRLAELGVRSVRYPILWERTAAGDWSWADERLGQLHFLHLRPIVGLLHHGSGPPTTSLTDPDFTHKFSAFAGSVAARYPWVDAYTPINEPLTTARFSGLYGHWYPHGRDGRTFVRILLNQCRGTALAMAAIRAHNPSAQLVQTEDLGKVYSTEVLSYQADFENLRRWLSIDLLCGRVDSRHPLWKYLLQEGASEAELEEFCLRPCPPDILGFNYYLTSERFLDDRLDLYPAALKGGNGRHAYVDIEAVRGREAGIAGAEVLLREAWERYGLPLALTEVHLGCTREEQLRWFVEVYEAALAIRRSGVDIRAVTAWAVFGTFGWRTLVSGDDDHYEPGVFDLRAPQPRPTILARLIRTLSANAPFEHPVLAAPGWWHRPERLYIPIEQVSSKPVSSSYPVILIVGATGTLGQAFARICEERGLVYCLVGRSQMDIAEPTSVHRTLNQLKPWAVINAAGYVRVDEAEQESERCFRENTTGPAVLAAACAERGIALIAFSSDLVFDGKKSSPYLETDLVRPLNIYGKSKAAAETLVLEAFPDALVVRTSAFFGPWDTCNFLTLCFKTLAADQVVFASGDVFISPTYVPDLVHACLDLLIDGERGIWHLANQGSLSWAAFARQAAQLANISMGRIEEYASDYAHSALRPHYSVLGSERGLPLPPLEQALSHYVRVGLY
ncbi:MAG: sugar nucleotide-binding protein [Anaerolineae bacterium]|nr:sugar nucleotide-binding protein [Gloeobacterales cyanobacterium ES-bin-313]